MSSMNNRPTLDDTIEIDGREVRRLRKESRLTQQRLATLAAPLSRGYISNIESTPRAQVGRPLAERLASALGVSVGGLVNRVIPWEDRSGLALPALPVEVDEDEGNDEANLIGERVAQLLRAADLSEEEEALAGDYLVAMADAVLRLIKVTKSLHQ